jgi:uncharacterized protein (UPF0262 family)
MSERTARHIVNITLDERIGKLAPEIARERDIAIADLLERNHFVPEGFAETQCRLHLSLADNRLLFDLVSDAEESGRRIGLSLEPFRRVIKDYFLICESHYAAMREGARSRIEAVDMTRRSLHDEGARLLIARLKGKADVDFNTARRLFTLLCALHFRG